MSRVVEFKPHKQKEYRRSGSLIRVLKMVGLVVDRGRTVKELVEVLGVSSKTVVRDLDALRSAGVRVVSEYRFYEEHGEKGLSRELVYIVPKGFLRRWM